MSREIDERVVSMEFDNKNFEANVRNSMSTIEKLKSALKFKGAEKGLQAVEKASSKVNFNGISNAVDQIGVRFSSMQVVATTALANITNAAVNAGRQMLNSFTLQPITSGFQEYETQIGSIQTILSNTRWQNTSLDQVNSALDELNTYADQTIYNFTEMTRNIGTFTAAGVGLDQSVAAIKGIANLAAVSGSSSQQASTAMYQLSQALAAGRVSLQDWNSVVNAGMGGKVFQDALVRTSELMGTGAEAAIETYGTFRESLTKGQWLTTDVLTETLKQISGAYTEADLISQGYTEEQAKEIVALAKDATDAATKVRTFSQLMDTTMEALGSGWTNTWEILIGDFNEATEFWTSISNVINDAVTQSADARNQMLQQWVDMGGRQNILDGLTAALEGLNNILTPIKEAFAEVFPPVTAQTLLDISTGFENLMVKFRDFAAGAAPVVKDVFTAIFSVLKAIGSIIGGVASGIGEFFGIITGSGDIGGIVSQLANFVTGAANAVTESGALAGVLTVLGNAFGNVLSAISSLITGGVSKLGDMFSGIGDIFGGVADILVTAASNISSGLGEILGTANFGSIIDVFNSGVLASLITSVSSWFKSLTGGVEESSKGLFDSIREMTSGITDTVSGTLDAVRGSLETWQTNIKTDILLKIAVAVVALVAAIAVLASIDPDRLTDALGALTVLFMELIGSMTLFTKLNTNMEQLTGIATMIAMAASIAILAGAMKSLSELDMDAIGRGMVAIAGLATIMVAVSKALSSGGNIAKGAVQLILMAAALKVLASVAIDLSALDWEGLAKGLVGVGVLMAEMAAFSQVVKSEGILKVSAAMILMSASLEILVDVVGKFGAMPIEQIATGLITVAVAIAEFAGLMRIFPKGTTIIKSAAGIFILALALESLVPAMQGFAGLGVEGAMIGVATIAGVLGTLSGLMAIMSKMDVFRLGAAASAIDQMSNVFTNLSNAISTMSQISVGGIVQSLVSLTTAVGLMMGMMVLMSKMDVGDVAAITVTMPALAGSLEIIANAISMIGGMNLENAAAASISLVAAIGSLAIGLKAVQGKFTSVASLMLVSVALVALAAAINLMATAGVLGAVVALVSLAGAMTVVGIATKILKPLIPSMYTLSTALLNFALSLGALSIAATAMGIGLGVIMTSLAAGIAALALIDPAAAGKGILILAGAFTVIGVAAKLLKPMIGSILSLSLSLLSFSVAAAAVSVSIAVLVAALTALGSIGEEGARTIVTTLKELIIGITAMIPELITNLMESFKTIILGLLDALVEIAPQLADGIFQILSQTIQSSLEYMPQIAGFFIDFLIQMLNTVRERLPELFPAVTGLIGDLIQMIMDALGQWQETGNSIEMAVGIFTGMIGLVVLLNYIKSMIPGAMVGLLELAAFVLEFGVILTALGALQELTGAASFINSAGDLLQSIGTAIGQFIGGLVGGFAEGATSTLPQVGTNLSQFAMNIMPFLIAMQMVDQKTIDGVTNLALAIAALAGANFVDAVTTFLSGGQDFGDLGAKLIPFGQAMVEFSNVVSGIDVEAINASAACGQALAALATSLPKEGGLAQAIFGESTDLGSFATQIVQFGIALKMYGIAVQGLNTEDIVASAQAGQALSDLASTLPKDGGLAQAIFGETTDMNAFGAQIVAFGLALRMYAAAVAGLDIESIQQSVTAGQALSDLANALPDEGGLVEWIFGGSGGLDGFGDSLIAFGEDLQGYAESLADVDFSAITNSINRVNSLRQAIQIAAGVDMSGLDNLKRIDELSQALYDYYTDVSEINSGAITSSIANLNNIRDFIVGLSGLDLSGANAFIQSVTDISNIAMNGITDTFEVGSLEATGQTLMTTLAGGMRLGLGDCTQAARDVIQGVCDELGNPGSVDIPGAGTSIVNKFAEGIKGNVATATGAVTEIMTAAVGALNGYEDDFRLAGSNLATGFANGISSSAYKARIASQAMANAAKTAAQQALDEHSPSKVMQQIGEYAGQGFVNGLSAYRDYSYSSGLSIADAAVSGVSTLTGIYDSFGDIEGTFKEITALSEKLNTAKKEDSKTTEKETENTSKLSDALQTTADSLQTLIDRKNDLKALNTILSKTGATLSDDFVAELLSSEGQYAGALTEMVNLTDEQMQRLSDIFDQTKLAEKMEDVTNTISQGISDMADRMSNINAVQQILSNVDLQFSDAFKAELLSSSGEYADMVSAIAQLSTDQINDIASLYDRTQTVDDMQAAVDALAETMTNLSKNKKDIKNLNVTFKRFGVTLSKRFQDELLDTSGTFADAISGIAELSDDMLQSLNDTFMENELFEQTREFISILAGDDSLAAAFEYSGASVDGFVEKIVNAGEDISDVTSKIQDFADTVSDGFSKMEIKDQTGVAEFTDNLENNIIMAREWANNVETVFGKLGNYPFAEEFKKEILEGGFDQYGRIIAELATSSREQIISLIETWNTADIYGAQLGTNVINAITPTQEQMEYAGSSIVEGMAHGVIMNTSSATDAITTMCQAVETQTRTFFGIHSPSKLMEELGRNLVQGFVNGLNSGTEALKKAMADVNQAVEFLKSIGEKGIDIEVRVTPVLDMADFNAKLSALQSSAASTVSSNIMGTVDSINESMSQNGAGNDAKQLTDAVKTLTNKVDSINPDNFGVTYQQINNSPKALSTATIYRQTKNQISLARSKNGNSFKQ